MNHSTKAALRDRQHKIDTHISKRGQDHAQRYLATHRSPLDLRLLGEALMGAVAILLLTYFTLA